MKGLMFSANFYGSMPGFARTFWILIVV